VGQWISRCAASGGALCVEKSSQTRAVLILLAWVTPWLPSLNGVTQVRGAPSRIPQKRSQKLANIKEKPLPSVAPTAAVECAAAENTTPRMVDDGGYSRAARTLTATRRAARTLAATSGARLYADSRP